MEATHFHITSKKGMDFKQPHASSLYHILLFKGEGSFMLDATEYTFSGYTILCFTPFQQFVWLGDPMADISILTFHGEFYCIEYHKKEVACNGLLFNNIYLYPHFSLSEEIYHEFLFLLKKISEEMPVESSFSNAVLKAYLQLLLALCSREKQKNMPAAAMETAFNREMADIQRLFDTYFLTERSVSFYASRTALSPSAFSKKTKSLFGKTPTQLIQDRVILEAKKLLHLTYKSVKEIADELHFDDEFYFSRYFKKQVGISPSYYREQTGISIAAK